MAEGYLKELSKEKQESVEAFSAGLLPSQVHPLAIQVMDEDGVDISQQQSKEISIFKNGDFDYVITLCDDAKNTCPTLPAKKQIHWSITDPASFSGEDKEKLAFFRKIRNDIKNRIESFINKEI